MRLGVKKFTPILDIFEMVFWFILSFLFTFNARFDIP